MAKRARANTAGDIDAETAEELFNAVRRGMSFEECLNHDEIRDSLAANLSSEGSPWTVEDVLERVFRDRRRQRGVQESFARFAHVDLSDELRHRVEAAAVAFRAENGDRTIEKLLISKPTRDAFTAILRSIGATDRELPTARRVAQSLFKNPERLTAIRESGAAGRPLRSPEPDIDELEARLLDLAAGDDEAAAGVRFVFQLLKARDGQAAFRKGVLAAYGGACPISGCSIFPALQAAHIEPFSGPASHRQGNGMPLRADLHVLFDADLLGIEPSTGVVHLHPAVVQSGDYAEIEGAILSAPVQSSAAPEEAALNERWQRFRERCRSPLSS
jgi:hypothetical protein